MNQKAIVFKKTIVIAGIFSLIISCQEADPEVSFETDLKPITERACTGYCHASWDHFTKYVNLKAVVENGVLKEKLIDLREMPLYPKSITEEERELFARWIEAGGPDN